MATIRLVFAIWLATAVAALKKNTLRGTTKARTAARLLCQLKVAIASTGQVGRPSESNHSYECSPVENGITSDFSYPINLPRDFVDKNKAALFDGSLFALVPGGQIVHSTVTYPVNSRITAHAAPDFIEERGLASSSSKTLLVVRVTTTDGTNLYTASQLYNYTFDMSQPDSKPSLASQLKRTSFGKLKLIPTKYGVLDVSINMKSAGTPAVDIRDAVTAYLKSTYSVSRITTLANYVMYCIPDGQGTLDGANVIGSTPMVLTDPGCGSLGSTMYWMGTNLGLPRGVQPGRRYDSSTYMGRISTTPYSPLMSYNGANHAQLGWYKDRLTTIDPSKGGQKLALATFVDYGKTNKLNPVLIKVGNDTFLQYNRAKDFNDETPMGVDQVTIVQQVPKVATIYKGGVDMDSQPVSLNDFGGSGRNLYVCACSEMNGTSRIPDIMIISVGYDSCYCE